MRERERERGGMSYICIYIERVEDRYVKERERERENRIRLSEREREREREE